MAEVDVYYTENHVGPPILIVIYGPNDLASWHHLSIAGEWTTIERVTEEGYSTYEERIHAEVR